MSKPRLTHTELNVRLRENNILSYVCAEKVNIVNIVIVNVNIIKFGNEPLFKVILNLEIEQCQHIFL